MSASRVDRSRRVAFLSPAAGLGGAERALLLQLEALRATPGVEEPVLVSLVDGPLLDLSRGAGVEVHLLALPPALLRVDEDRLRDPLALLRLLPAGVGGARYLATLRRLLGDLAVDVVHCNGLKAHVLGALARPRGVGVVWHLHDYLSSRPASRRLLRLLARRAAGAVGVSHVQAEDVRRALGGRFPVEVVRNAIDLARFSPVGECAPLDALAGLPLAPAGTVRVGLVATYAAWKGHRTFLGAGRTLLRALPPGTAVRLYVVGGPIYDTSASQLGATDISRWVDELGLSGQVGLVPFQTETPPVYRALDVVVHASVEPEPFGLVVGEAMACGRAVVAVETAGAVESFRPETELLVTPPGDEAGLAMALARVVLEPGLRARLGERAREGAERALTPAGQVASLRAAWRRFGVLAQPSEA